jgi:hypothetical protein
MDSLKMTRHKIDYVSNCWNQLPKMASLTPTQPETINIYSSTSIDNPKKIRVYFGDGIPHAPTREVFSVAFNCRCIEMFLEVAPKKSKERYARKQFWAEKLGAKRS